MTHYSQHSNHVRVDFFKASGKWYTTEEMEWIGPWKADNAPLIWEQFLESLKQHLKQDSFQYPIRMSGMWAVCLYPYHENAHPLMMIVPAEL